LESITISLGKVAYLPVSETEPCSVTVLQFENALFSFVQLVIRLCKTNTWLVNSIAVYTISLWSYEAPMAFPGSH